MIRANSSRVPTHRCVSMKENIIYQFHRSSVGCGHRVKGAIRKMLQRARSHPRDGIRRVSVQGMIAAPLRLRTLASISNFGIDRLPTSVPLTAVSFLRSLTPPQSHGLVNGSCRYVSSGLCGMTCSKLGNSRRNHHDDVALYSGKNIRSK